MPLSPYKYIYHTHHSKSGLPVRGGLARAAAWGYLFKNFDIRSWVQFAEICGIPLRVGKYGPGASEKDKQVLLNAVRNITQDAAGIIPASMVIEFVEAKISGNITLFEKLADYLDKQVSKSVLGQTGTTDTGSRVGTANAHEHVRQDIETADAGQLAATLNRDLVRPTVDLNLGPRKLYPHLTIARPNEEDLDKLTARIATLVPMGLRVETSVAQDKLGLPDPPAGAVLLHAPQGSGDLPEGDTLTPPRLDPEGKSAVAAASRAINAALPAAPGTPMDAVDTAVAEQLDGWQPLVNPLVEPIRKLLDACLQQGLSLEDFQQRLAGLVGTQDTGPLTEHLAQLSFAARLGGETGATGGK